MEGGIEGREELSIGQRVCRRCYRKGEGQQRLLLPQVSVLMGRRTKLYALPVATASGSGGFRVVIRECTACVTREVESVGCSVNVRPVSMGIKFLVVHVTDPILCAKQTAVDTAGFRKACDEEAGGLCVG